MTERMDVIERLVNGGVCICEGQEPRCNKCVALAALASIRTEVAAQQSEIERLTKENRMMNTSISNIAADLLRGSRRSEEQQAEIAEFRADYASMENRIRNISAQMDRERETAQAEIAALRGLLGAAKRGTYAALIHGRLEIHAPANAAKRTSVSPPWATRGSSHS